MQAILKLELGIEIIENLELPAWIHLTLVTDGFYGSKKNFAFKLLEKGVDIVSRLRMDAAIYELPPEKQPKKRQLRILFQRECMLQLFFRLLGQLGITHEKELVIKVFNSLLNPINKNQYEQIIMEKDDFVYTF